MKGREEHKASEKASKKANAPDSCVCACVCVTLTFFLLSLCVASLLLIARPPCLGSRRSPPLPPSSLVGGPVHAMQSPSQCHTICTEAIAHTHKGKKKGYRGLYNPSVLSCSLSRARVRCSCSCCCLFCCLPTFVIPHPAASPLDFPPLFRRPQNHKQWDTADLARPFNHPSSSHPSTGHNPHAHRRPVASDQR